MKSKRSSSHCIQNRNLFLAKALFFSNAMSSVGWTRFQNNYYLDNGLTSYEIGSLKSAGLILKFFGEPIWCLIADLTDTKIIYALGMLMQILSMEILRNAAKPLTFKLIFFVKILRTTTASSNTLTTAASFKLTEGTNEGYGRQRMFASIAWGIGALVVGCLIDAYGMDSLFFYTYFFVGVSFVLAICGLPSKWSQSKPTSAASSSDATSPFESMKKYVFEMGMFFSNAPCRALLINAFGYGMAMTVPDTFLFISLEQDFGASRSFSGLCTTTSIIACLPIFWYSDQLLAKYGHFNMIYFAEMACVIRLFAYAVLPIWWSPSLKLILVVQLIHGVNFALFWSAMVDAIFKLAPPELSTSCMAALNVVYFTLAGALGNLIWGWVYDLTGGVFTVYWCSALALLVFVLPFRETETMLRTALSICSSSSHAVHNLVLPTSVQPEVVSPEKHNGHP